MNNDDNVQYEVDESIEDDDEEDEEERLYECVFPGAHGVERYPSHRHRQQTRHPQKSARCHQKCFTPQTCGSRPTTTIDEMNEFREAEVSDLANKNMLNKFAYDLVSKIEQAVFHFHNNEENPYTQTQRQQETQGNNLNNNGAIPTSSERRRRRIRMVLVQRHR